MSDAETQERTGRCMCGAVEFTAQIKLELSACHCGMCRRWSGGPLLCVPTLKVRWADETKIVTFESSAWAERGHCGVCGSNLFYRITETNAPEAGYALPMGLLDDQSGLDFNREWFIDAKPEGYAFSGERECLTEAQVMAMFAPS
ncbi:GFA family protein [Pseudenhygromyxa sp. WMMC2535]|uniref:GFA family protein n=1 Tax=Pseudenhygromyxa sp. WMMC2535 TaxID=2712867 RepID=UPI0015520453|nr:GFA family protein [Pseudenhygromyxa sp. WMMC2535]NVB36264.1 GFA family protein [Pseudenhygromyxa sp. WMMC2535]